MSSSNPNISPAVHRLQQVILWCWMISMGCVLYGSLSPDLSVDIRIQNSDKIMHALAYAWLALGARMSFIPASKSFGLGLFLLGLGLGIELVQSVIPGRFFSWADILANFLGILSGLAVAAGISRTGVRFLAHLIQ